MATAIVDCHFSAGAPCPLASGARRTLLRLAKSRLGKSKAWKADGDVLDETAYPRGLRAISRTRRKKLGNSSTVEHRVYAQAIDLPDCVFESEELLIPPVP
jgi:hypothetical protein